MRDAIGGVFNITFIAIFITIVSGYLAFSISYQKAYKVKNKVISTIEQYQGYNQTTIDVIDQYIEDIGYNTNNAIDPPIGNSDATKLCYNRCQNGYCVYWIKNDDNIAAGRNSGYFKVYTSAAINLPIINKFLPYMEIFQTSGDTMTINNANGCQ